MKFQLHKNHTLNSTMGHTIEFKKGERVYVPKEVWKEAVAIGAIPETELPEEVLHTKDEVLDPEDRKAMIFAAMEQVVLKGDRESFTGNGSPHAKVISEIVNFAVDAKERDLMWNEFRQSQKADD